jgi:hypothetical protein
MVKRRIVHVSAAVDDAARDIPISGYRFGLDFLPLVVQTEGHGVNDLS